MMMPIYHNMAEEIGSILGGGKVIKSRLIALREELRRKNCAARFVDLHDATLVRDPNETQIGAIMSKMGHCEKYASLHELKHAWHSFYRNAESDYMYGYGTYVHEIEGFNNEVLPVALATAIKGMEATK